MRMIRWLAILGVAPKIRGKEYPAVDPLYVAPVEEDVDNADAPKRDVERRPLWGYREDDKFERMCIAMEPVMTPNGTRFTTPLSGWFNEIRDTMQLLGRLRDALVKNAMVPLVSYSSFTDDRYTNVQDRRANETLLRAMQTPPCHLQRDSRVSMLVARSHHGVVVRQRQGVPGYAAVENAIANAQNALGDPDAATLHLIGVALTELCSFFLRRQINPLEPRPMDIAPPPKRRAQRPEKRRRDEDRETEVETDD